MKHIVEERDILLPYLVGLVYALCSVIVYLHLILIWWIIRGLIRVRMVEIICYMDKFEVSHNHNHSSFDYSNVVLHVTDSLLEIMHLLLELGRLLLSCHALF